MYGMALTIIITTHIYILLDLVEMITLGVGEKTLSLLALVFALYHYTPTPLYVMDEINAVLDFKNVSIVANYIKEWTNNEQLIIIYLRNNMFEWTHMKAYFLWAQILQVIFHSLSNTYIDTYFSK